MEGQIGSGDGYWIMKLSDASGEIIEHRGFWLNDKPHGPGEKKFPDGRWILGEVVEGNDIYKGALIYPNGNAEYGEIDLDSQYGERLFVDENGKRHIRYYRENLDKPKKQVSIEGFIAENRP